MTTKAEKLRALERWESAITKTELAIANMHRSIGLQPDGGLMTILESIANELTKTVAELVGDQKEWLHWYRYQNDMGAHGFKAGPRGQTREIRCLEDLLWVIEVKT